jgi:hypothetical protein
MVFIIWLRLIAILGGCEEKGEFALQSYDRC